MAMDQYQANQIVLQLIELRDRTAKLDTAVRRMLPTEPGALTDDEAARLLAEVLDHATFAARTRIGVKVRWDTWSIVARTILRDVARQSDGHTADRWDCWELVRAVAAVWDRSALWHATGRCLTPGRLQRVRRIATEAGML